ncbi:MAG: hypothetical protein ACRDK7_07680 [Solirubrobacteraceae bacterium]
MELKTLKPAPAFDPAQPCGELYPSSKSTLKARYQQGPHYFAGNHEYLGSDPSVKNVARSKKAEAPKPGPGARQIAEEELPKLLEHPRAQELMELPLDKLAQIVAAANGPSFSGDRAHALYTGWLLKYTNVDG